MTAHFDSLLPADVAASIAAAGFDPRLMGLVARNGDHLWFVHEGNPRRWALSHDRVRVQLGFITTALHQAIRAAVRAGEPVYIAVTQNRLQLDPEHHRPPAPAPSIAPPAAPGAPSEAPVSGPSLSEDAVRGALRAHPLPTVTE